MAPSTTLTPTLPEPSAGAENLKSFSFGGGVQSMAALVLAAQGQLDYRTFLFAHVGDDSENPATLTYLDQYAKPFAEAHGIELTVLHRVMVRSKETRTLYGEITRDGSKALKIPVRFKNGAPGKRACTHDYKIETIARELKRRGASALLPATVGIGISLDEIHRANERRAEKHERIEYPLLKLGLRRVDCARVIREAGLPVPPKSSCWFCPFKRPETWHEMRRKEPEQFEKACQLEDYLNERQARLGKNAVFLTKYGQPLRQAIPDGVEPLFDFDDKADGLCDSGWCMT